MQTNKIETTQTTEIFITKDYSLFKKLKGNRNLNKLNLKKITKSIEKIHIPIPIVVNEKYEISEERFCELFQITPTKYENYIKGNYNYTVKDMGLLNAVHALLENEKNELNAP